MNKLLKQIKILIDLDNNLMKKLKKHFNYTQK